MKTIKILIYEPSEIIFTGIKNVLKQIWGKNIEIYELSDYSSLTPIFLKYQPDILLLDLSLIRTGEVKKEPQATRLQTYCFTTLY